jgi:hypothetical protein
VVPVTMPECRLEARRVIGQRLRRRHGCGPDLLFYVEEIARCRSSTLPAV